MFLSSTPSLRPLRWLLPALLLLLGACATGGYGVPGSGYPGTYPGSSYPPPSARQELQGTVSNVDHGNRRFLLQEERGGRADISYDQGTRLVYQGREQSVAGLEPGDQVRVLATRSGNLWRADDIQVLADGRGGYGAGSDYGSNERRGAIDFVDTRARLIGFTEGGYTGNQQRVGYDSRTVVEYRGQRYPTDALERGDLVRMWLVRGNNGWIAERILVEVSARER
jgi:hypothetical protein